MSENLCEATTFYRTELELGLNAALFGALLTSAGVFRLRDFFLRTVADDDLSS